jgi:polyisoprenoid-binding protein YceI
MTSLHGKLFAMAILALAPIAASADVTEWNIDPVHSEAGFSVRHLVISKVRGKFDKFSGTVRLDEKDVSNSSVQASLDVASIDTGVGDRDKHLRSPDFFDAEKFPTIAFKSTKIAKAGKDALKIAGDLTMHGVTRPVTLETTVSQEIKGMMGETRRGFSATTKIDRKDFGLVWNKMVETGPVVGDEVTITLDIEAIKSQPKAN